MQPLDKKGTLLSKRIAVQHGTVPSRERGDQPIGRLHPAPPSFDSATLNITMIGGRSSALHGVCVSTALPFASSIRVTRPAGHLHAYRFECEH